MNKLTIAIVYSIAALTDPTAASFPDIESESVSRNHNMASICF